MSDSAAFMYSPWFWVMYLTIVVPLFIYAAWNEIKYGSPSSYEQKMRDKLKVDELERAAAIRSMK